MCMLHDSHNPLNFMLMLAFVGNFNSKSYKLPVKFKKGM